VQSTRHTTVLFADVSGSTKLYDSVGDTAAFEAIGACVDQLRRSAEADGGRVVKTMGDEVMVLFPSPDAAASAATRMHTAIASLPVVGNNKLALRIGFHTGAVVQQNNDIFGDTVNIASRLADQAVRGQILTSRETAALLGGFIRNWTRPLYSIQIRGKAEEVAICEIVWHQSPDVTEAVGSSVARKPAPVTLRLQYHGQEAVRRRGHDAIMIGRGPDCELVISDPKASRQHCTVERREDRFVLQDHSTNGTYVTADGEKEILLQREDLTLSGHGWIAFGQPRASTTDIVEYFCEQAPE
jgi:adenylate cyclase